MTEQQHPITPPPELVGQIRRKALHESDGQLDYELRLIRDGYRAGADQQLEACCKAIADQIITVGNIGLSGPTGVLHRETHSSWPAFAQMVSRQLRAAMRPKPKSLKEQALGLLNEGPVSDLLDHEVAVIRRALESLPD